MGEENKLELVVEEPTSSLGTPPVVATTTNVHGEGGMIVLHFHYLPQALVDRWLDTPPEGANKEGDVLTVHLPPVARVALPMASATELILGLLSELSQQLPELQQTLLDFNEKVQKPGAERVLGEEPVK